MKVYVGADTKAPTSTAPESPWPFRIYRVYLVGRQSQPLLVLAHSFAGAIEKTEKAGFRVSSVAHVEMEAGMEVATSERVSVG